MRRGGQKWRRGSRWRGEWKEDRGGAGGGRRGGAGA